MNKTKQILKYDYTQIDLDELERQQIHERCMNYIYPNLKNKRKKVRIALIPEQQQILEEYYNFLLAGGEKAKKPISIFNIIQPLYAISKAIPKPYSMWTKKDLQNYFAKLSTRCKATTVVTKKIKLKQFFRWFKDEDTPEITSWFKTTMPKPEKLNPADILTPVEIKQIVNACDNERDSALFMVIYEGGERNSEARNIKIKDLQEVENGYKIQVEGKTGRRTLLFIDSTPYIKSWLNKHPLKDNPNALLFPELNNIRFGAKLYRSKVWGLLQKAVSRTKIKKKVWPHLLRKSRLTYLTKYLGFTEVDLRVFSGWTPNSNMSAIYVTFDEDHVHNKLLQHKGLISDEYLKKQKDQDKALTPKICPTCNKSNPSTNIYCSCGEILDKSSLDRKQVKDYSNLMDDFMKSKFGKELKSIFKEFLEAKGGLK